jgi:hypothetical protein
LESIVAVLNLVTLSLYIEMKYLLTEELKESAEIRAQCRTIKITKRKQRKTRGTVKQYEDNAGLNLQRVQLYYDNAELERQCRNTRTMRDLCRECSYNMAMQD